MNALFLQIFLVVNIFLIGALTAIAIQHAYAHFRPRPLDAEKPHPRPAQNAHLPFEVRRRLLMTAETRFQSVLDRSADELQHDLKTTAAQINTQLGRLGSDIVRDEMKRYHEGLDQLRAQTEAIIGSAQAEIASHQADLVAKLNDRQAEQELSLSARRIELEVKMTDEIASEKQQLASLVDAKLGDAVASFLVETLQHNVDLGAQSTYLTAMLEEHKSELVKGIKDEI